MPLYKQNPGETNYVQTVNQYTDALSGASDVGAVALFGPVVTLPVAPTVAAAAGTALGVGSYLYKVTFVTGAVKGDGSLLIQGVTAGGATSATLTTTSGNQAGALTNIAIGPAGTIARRLYRTALNGADGTQKLITTIADNTTTSYTDSTPDGSLGGAVPTANSTGTTFTLGSGDSVDDDIIWRLINE